MKERDVKGGEILGGTNGLKESEVLVVGFCRVIKEKLVSGSIRQLSVSLSKRLVEDHSGTVQFVGRIRMWGLDLREWRAWCSGAVRLLLEGRDLVKLGWETVDRMWEI